MTSHSFERRGKTFICVRWNAAISGQLWAHAWHCFLIEKFSLVFSEFAVFAVVAISLYQKLITFKPFCFPLSAVKWSPEMLLLSLILHLVSPSIFPFPKKCTKNSPPPKKKEKHPREKDKGEKKIALLFASHPHVLNCLPRFNGDIGDCE